MKNRFALLIVLLIAALVSASCGVLDFVDYLLYEEDGEYWDEDSDDWDDDWDNEDDWDDEGDWDDEEIDDSNDVDSEDWEAESESSAGEVSVADNAAGAIACVKDVDPFNLQNGEIPSIDVSGWVDEETEVLAIVNYDVRNDEIVNPETENDIPAELDSVQNNDDLHAEIWDFFTDLIPATFRSYLVEFQMMTDGEDEILASVYQTQDDAYEWGLEVDIMDIDDTYEFFATLMHEYGHLLSLNPSQVEPSMAIFNDPEDDDVYYAEADACPNYFPGEGCSKADSYINLFVERFWNEVFDEWLDVDSIQDDDAYYDALDQFYYDHEDAFVSDYAVTNPAEDFAETFSAFIMDPTPAGSTTAEKKVLFFYEFPELVALRENVVSSLCGMVE